MHIAHDSEYSSTRQPNSKKCTKVDFLIKINYTKPWENPRRHLTSSSSDILNMPGEVFKSHTRQTYGASGATPSEALNSRDME